VASITSRGSTPAASAVGPKSASRELANLDFMRALAVLLVVADHVLETAGVHLGMAFHPLDWYLGRMGVLMFFVHTSLVLMLSMDRSRHQGAAFFLSFYIRRVFRIYPLSLVCIAIVLLVGIPPTAWQSGPTELSTYDKVANLLLVQNLLHADNVLSPLWSLPLELQMYAVLPVLYLFLRRMEANRAAWILFAVAVVVGIVQPWVPGASRLNVARFGPCFVAGVLAYVGLRGAVPRWRPAAWAGLLFAVTGAYLAVAWSLSVTHPAWLGWLYCLVIGLAIPRFHHFGPGLIQRGSHFVAKYSYGVYLFHMVALWLGLGPTSPWPLGPVAGSAVFLLVLVGAPVLSYHLVEHPLIDWGTKVAEGAVRLTGRRTAVPARA
jgi:peptidoglycan/LPS O-acetylase OafA/YrhL